MNTRSFILLVIAALGLTACKNGAQKVEPQQLEADSTTVVVSDHPITDRLYAELDSADVYNDSILFGYWFKPHEACYVNIFFHKDNTYEFKYYEVGKGDEITDMNKKGTFTFDGKVITLASDEGWNDYFNGVMYYKNNGTNFYLTDKEEELYLVKGSD
jgi:hypothetical protein